MEILTAHEADILERRQAALTKLYQEDRIPFHIVKTARKPCTRCGKVPGPNTPVEMCDVDEQLTCRRCFVKLYVRVGLLGLPLAPTKERP